MRKFWIAFLFVLAWMFGPTLIAGAEEYPSERLINLEAAVAQRTAACMQQTQRAPLTVTGYVNGWVIDERGESAIRISAQPTRASDGFAAFAHKELVVTFYHPVPWEIAIPCFLSAYPDDGISPGA